MSEKFLYSSQRANAVKPFQRLLKGETQNIVMSGMISLAKRSTE